MSVRRALALAVALVACAGRPRESPTCPSDAEVRATLQRFLGRAPQPAPPAGLTAAGAACGARKLAAALAASQGGVVGYKAGLTNPALQLRFGVREPVRGTLFARMLLPDGSVVPARYGARPVVEADLVVEVGTAAIHRATTPLEVLASLRAVYPFIELADLMMEESAPVTAQAIVLYNAGARLGVLGAPVPVRADAAFAGALHDMTVRLTDGAGRELERAPGSAILGHPLHAVRWLAGDLRRSGIMLAPGDLLSLGALSRPWPAEPGATMRVTYDGLPGDPSVHVRFE